MPQEESLSVRFIGDNTSLEKASLEAAKSLDKVGAASESTTRSLDKVSTVSDKASKAAQNIATAASSMDASLTKAGNNVNQTFAKIATEANQVGTAFDKPVSQAIQSFDTLEASGQKVANSASVMAASFAGAGSKAAEAFAKIAAIDPGEGFTKAQEKITTSINKIESEATGLGTAFDKPLTQAAASFDKVDKAAADSAKSLNKSAIVSEKASKAAEQLAKSSAIAGGSLDKSRKNTGAATQSLINLSRVAQDAPFGFIGIANNLNPLLESFQRLQVETKGSGGALKALGASLAGPAGIGLAIGVVSSLMISFGDQIGKFFSKLSSGHFALKQFNNDLREIFANAVKSVGPELVRLDVLQKKINDSNTTGAERIKLVKEYNKVADDTNKIDLAQIGNLTLLNEKIDAQNKLITQRALSTAALSKLTEASNDFIEVQLKFQAALNNTGLSVDNVKDAAEKQLVAQVAQTKAVKQGLDGVNTFNRNLQLTASNTNNVSSALVQMYRDMQAGELKFNRLADSLKGFITVEGLTTKATQDLETLGKKRVDFNFFDKFFDFDFNGKLAEKQIASLLDAANAFAKEFGGILEGLDFNKESKPASLEAAKQFWKNYKEGIVKLKPQKLIDDITVEAPQIKLTDGSQQIDDLLKGIQQGFNKINPNDVGLLPDALESQRITTLAKFTKLYHDIGLALPTIIKKELENGLTQDVPIEDIPVPDLAPSLQKPLDQIIAFRDAVRSTLLSAFSDLGTNVGQAIAQGLNPLTEASSTIVEIMSSLISTMGDALIKYGIVKTGIDKILGPGGFKIPGGLAIALGLAAKAASSILKASKPKGFAAGGLAFGPTLGLVGEGRGTNRSNPEVIAPLDKLSQYLGAGQQGTMIVGRLRGADLELQRSRVGRRQRRHA